MFTAQFEDGTVISLVDSWHLGELQILRKKKSFYCPVCKEEVVLKLGKIRQWHFAHIPDTNCDYAREHGESMYHLEGKKQLYNWLKQHTTYVRLEVYLPLIKQRPDILIKIDNKLYAIEFQCASIQPQILKQRSAGYRQAGITPIWILGGNRLVRQSTSVFTIRSFEWLTVRQSSSEMYYLTYFCPKNKKIVFLSDLLPYSPTRFIASYEEYPINTFAVEQFLEFNERSTNIANEWLTIKKLWRYRPTRHYPIFMRELLYQRGVHPQLFPLEAGWPTKNHHFIETSTCYWQTFLLLECLEHQPLHQPFSKNIVKRCLHTYRNRQLFSYRQMLENEDLSSAIDHYLQFLCHLHYLQDKGKGMYMRIRERINLTTIDEAVELDRDYFYNKFIQYYNLEMKRIKKLS